MFVNKLVMYIFLCGVFIIPAISSERMTYLLDDYTIETLFNDGINCTKPGKTCDGCNKVSYCIELPDGNWIKEELYPCSTDYTCLESLSDCTTEPNPKCDSNVVDFKFKCHQTGVFPDPFDCKSYHICPPLDAGSLAPVDTPFSYKCGEGYGFDPLRALCRIKLQNGTCPTTPLVPACNVTGQTGGVPGNPSMYYICLKNANETTYFPQLFFCPFNQEYIGNRCENPTPIGTDVDGKCIAKSLYSDPLSCKTYLECSAAGLIPTRRNCEVGLKFSHKDQKCIAFQC